MNKQLISKKAQQWTLFVVATFVVTGVFLGVSALIARTPSKSLPSKAAREASQPEGKCQKWFHDLEQRQKDDVREVLKEALKQSATNQTLRDTLLNPDHCYKLAKDEIQERVDNYIHDNHHPLPVHFPPDWRVIFWQAEPISPTPTPSPETESQSRGTDPEREEHCLLIVKLPDWGEPTDNLDPDAQVRCCYKPW